MSKMPDADLRALLAAEKADALSAMAASNVLYSFIKDALLSKVGIVKVWWETREEHERETYDDLDDAAFAIIAADPDVEIVAHTQRRVANGDTGSEDPASEDLAAARSGRSLVARCRPPFAPP